MLTPLHIGVQFLHLLTERQNSTVKIDVQNLLPGPLLSVSITISSKGFSVKNRSPETIPAWRAQTHLLEISPRAAGDYLVGIRVKGLTSTGERFEGQATLRKDVRIHAQRKLPNALGEGAFFIDMTGIENLDAGLSDGEFEYAVFEWFESPASQELETNGENRTPSSVTWDVTYGEWRQIPEMDLHFLQTQVSQKLWENVMRESLIESLRRKPNVETFVNGRLDLFAPAMPVFGVTHSEAEEFCDRFTELVVQRDILPPGWVIRLPTIAEWRKACAGIPEGDIHHWCYNLAFKKYRNRRPGPLPVYGEGGVQSILQPNIHGLYAMLGNLFEWCALDPTEPRPLRASLMGGSWSPNDDRNHRNPDYTFSESVDLRSSRFGFRPVACETSKNL